MFKKNIKLLNIYFSKILQLPHIIKSINWIFAQMKRHRFKSTIYTFRLQLKHKVFLYSS